MLKLCILVGVIVVCYSASTHFEPKVEGGVPIEIETAPYAASVQSPGNKGRIHASTGTILNNRWILTTASRLQYFTDPRAFHIRTGSTHSDYSDYAAYSVYEKILHPSYDSNSDDFDLVLLKVDTDIEFNEKTASIELLSENSVDANLTGSLVGWGNTYIGSLKDSRLYSVDLKTVGTIDGTNLYVSTNNDDVCISDVGGAFVVDGKVIGISTLSQLGCGLTEKFVTRFDEKTIEWINSVIA